MASQQNGKGEEISAGVVTKRFCPNCKKKTNWVRCRVLKYFVISTPETVRINMKCELCGKTDDIL